MCTHAHRVKYIQDSTFGSSAQSRPGFKKRRAEDGYAVGDLEVTGWRRNMEIDGEFSENPADREVSLWIDSGKKQAMPSFCLDDRPLVWK